MRLGVARAYAGGGFVPGDVEIAGGRVVALGCAPAGSGTAVPGFVDLQVNGFGGVDFLGASAAGYGRAGAAIAATGVTSFLPTLITSPPEAMLAALATLGSLPEGMAPRVLGAHLEGPFLSPEKAGTHPVEDLLSPERGLLDRLLAAGPVRMVTLAPELDGALELVGHLVARGVVVSCGHSNATAAEAARAFDSGARAATHLLNAMRGISARDPGLAGAALARDGVVVQLIADGVHLAPETVLLAWRAARGRIALVTDAIAAAGGSDGEYRLGSVAVHVRGREARRADGVLAGSVLTMDAALRNVVAWGIPLAEAVAGLTAVPAGLLGRDDVGVLEVGGQADVVVLDDRLEVARVLVGGQDVS